VSIELTREGLGRALSGSNILRVRGHRVATRFLRLNRRRNRDFHGPPREHCTTQNKHVFVSRRTSVVKRGPRVPDAEISFPVTGAESSLMI